MVYLLDTHVLIWRISGNPLLSPNAIKEIDYASNTLFLSKASLWEMAIKITLNKLQLSIAFKELQAYLKNKNIVELDFNHDDLNMLIQLPLQHRDPFDHLIISQAINRGLTILTDDSKFELYPTMLLRA